MRIALIPAPATVALLCANAGMAQSPATAQDVRNLVPATAMVEQFVVTPDSVRPRGTIRTGVIPTRAAPASSSLAPSPFTSDTSTYTGNLPVTM